MYAPIVAFLTGATAMASCIAGLLFLRFWKKTHDSFFRYFALGFWVLCLNWTLVAIGHPTSETQHYYYVLRLVGFGFIIAAIVQKNRER